MAVDFLRSAGRSYYFPIDSLFFTVGSCEIVATLKARMTLGEGRWLLCCHGRHRMSGGR